MALQKNNCSGSKKLFFRHCSDETQRSSALQKKQFFRLQKSVFLRTNLIKFMQAWLCKKTIFQALKIVFFSVLLSWNSDKPGFAKKMDAKKKCCICWTRAWRPSKCSSAAGGQFATNAAAGPGPPPGIGPCAIVFAGPYGAVFICCNETPLRTKTAIPSNGAQSGCWMISTTEQQNSHGTDEWQWEIHLWPWAGSAPTHQKKPALQFHSRRLLRFELQQWSPNEPHLLMSIQELISWHHRRCVYSLSIVQEFTV